MKRQKQRMGILVGLVLGVFGVLGTFSTTASAQSPGTWTLTGSMTTGRSDFTATLLANGEVLVAGGCLGGSGDPYCHSSATASAELYDPTTGIWTSTNPMAAPRLSHTATLLPDGRVLVAGGEGASGAISSAELYDPSTGVWSATGSMSTARSGHVATLIASGPLSGMVIASGGSSACRGCTPLLASAELYDPSTGTWSLTGSMTLARFWDYSSPAALPGGSVFVVGGITCCPYHWFNKAELYDPATQTWAPTSKKTTTANGRTAVMPNGQVLVAGGVTGTQPTAKNVATAELFEPSTGMWTATASMSIDRNAHTLTLLPSGQVLVAGGLDGGWGVCNDLTSAELYDSGAGKWILTGTMNAARQWYTATLLPNGQVLAAGGQNCEGNGLSSAELYTPPTAMPVVALSTRSLKFAVQLVGSTSPAQAVTLTNAGGATLTISSIAASPNFLQQNNCGSGVAAGASCDISVDFRPSTRGTRTGAVTITDNAADSPQTITLTGTGTVVELSPRSVNFGDQAVGTTSPPHTITLTNVGIAPLRIVEIGVGGPDFGDFPEATTCPSSLAAKASCAINVRFRPSATGARKASVVVSDNGGGSPQRVGLVGNGT